MDKIPFNWPKALGNEEKYLLEALHSGKWCGRGAKTLALEKRAKEITKAKHCFFVTSCTSALELSCLVAGIKEGDEVILPSFGFVSAANAVVLRGGRPVFADIDLDTWNLSLETVEPLVSKKTKAIITVHYAGSGAGVEELREVCERRGVFLIEDAAQSLGAKRNGAVIGPTPWTTCFSLHETKNIVCGEGGLIMTDDEDLAGRLEIQIEKGTNRQKYFRGQVDKYTWVDVGSSYIASDLLAAVALAQLEKIEEITRRRLEIYNRYREGLDTMGGKLRWQSFPAGIQHNGHIAAVCMNPKIRPEALKQIRESGVEAAFHYVPLHDAPFAKENGFVPEQDLPNTRLISDGLIRLPLWYGMSDQQVNRVMEVVGNVFKRLL